MAGAEAHCPGEVQNQAVASGTLRDGSLQDCRSRLEMEADEQASLKVLGVGRFVFRLQEASAHHLQRTGEDRDGQ